MGDKYILFGHFPLHVCVMGLVFIFFNLAWFMFLINVVDYKTYKAAFSLAMFSAFWIVVSWAIVLYGMLKKSYRAIFAAFLLWTVFVIYWLLVVLVSAFVGSTSQMLVKHRGPESLWTVYNVYNLDQFDFDYEYYDHSPHARRAGSICVDRLSSDEIATSSPAASELREPDDPPPPPLAASLVTRKSGSMKWLLIIACFTAYAYLIFGSWYLLLCYYNKIRLDLLCACPAVCLAHETCCPDETLEHVAAAE